MAGVNIKSARQIALMREAGRVAAETLIGVDRMIRASITTEDIDRFAHEDILKREGKPAALNFNTEPRGTGV